MFEGDLKDERITSNTIRLVKFLGTVRKYELLHTLEFDSDRKRMSVIVKCLQTKRIMVLSKGAEDSIFAKCKNGNIEECNRVLSVFAQQGWRTLVLAYRFLSEDEYSIFDQNLNEAYRDLLNRDTKLKNIYEEIESGLVLVGSTAVEDRLQEDVASTLESLRQAGIKIWVLTGDKRETASKLLFIL